MSVSTRLRSTLEENEIEFATISHVPTYSAQYSAEMMHVPGGDVAKAVLLRSCNQNLLVLLPAPYHINLSRLSAAVGAPVQMIDEGTCNRVFSDCEPGSIPAFGELYGLPVYIDQSLADDPELVLSTGSHADAIQMSSADFIRLVRPRICSFAEKP
jgi:Ala-tRNA(Pro) deacylase